VAWRPEESIQRALADKVNMMSDGKPTKNPIPTGWLERGARLAGATGKSAARFVGTRVRTIASPQRSGEFLDGFHQRTAQQLVDMLGEMKGAAMKLGQLASFYEFAAPSEYLATYRDALTMLQNSAPPMDPRASKEVIEEEFGRPVDEVFPVFQEDPVASASIGQVHRATLPDGSDVAVKVQYPGVDEAVRADIKNVSAMTKLAVAIAPNLDPREIANEVRERVLEELDYRREAKNQERFAELYDGHPYIVVPKVHLDYCHTRVITQEFVEGERFMAVFDKPWKERNHIAEVLFRFFYGSLNRFCLFSADPHPGNYLILGGGRVAFLDYGLVRAVDPGTLNTLQELSLALIEDDKEQGRIALESLGILSRRTPEIDAVWQHLRDLNRPVLTDGEFELSADLVQDLGAAGFDPRTEAFQTLRKVGMPGVILTLNRMSFGVASILGRLGARNNWQAIARELWFGDESLTEIGKAESEWLAEYHPEVEPPLGYTT
jgi:predicted unusual protein kinase regulating ubiquinone biosynthesis (AarF/ABC1/UbiB family)